MKRISRYKTSSLYLRDNERKTEEQQEIEAPSVKRICMGPIGCLQYNALCEHMHVYNNVTTDVIQDV